MFKLPKLENIGNKLNEYIDSRLDLIKLDLQTSVSKALTRISILVLNLFLVFLIFFFASLGLAGTLNELFGNLYGGYLVLAALYFLFLVCLQLKPVQRRLKKTIDQVIDKVIAHPNEQQP